MVEILHRRTKAVLWSGEAISTREAIEKAVSAGADLADAFLADADLADAFLADAFLADADLADAFLADAFLADADLADAFLADAYLADARNYVPGAPDPVEPYVRPKTPAEAVAMRLERARRFRERHPEIPVVERLDQKILDAVAPGAGGVLNMSTWHLCETTHCRAGWTTRLAGEAGAKLEAVHGCQHAATLIYRASTGRVPHFFATDARAMEDLRRCAAEDAELNGDAPQVSP